MINYIAETTRNAFGACGFVNQLGNTFICSFVVIFTFLWATWSLCQDERAHHLTCASWLTFSLSLSTESSLQMAADPFISGPHRSDAAFILSSWYENTALRWAVCACAFVLLVLLIKHPIVTILNRSDSRSSFSGCVSVTPGRSRCDADLAGGRGLHSFDVNMGSVSLVRSQSLDAGLIWDGEMSFSPLCMCYTRAVQVVTFVFFMLQNIPVMLKLGAELVSPASLCP